MPCESASRTSPPTCAKHSTTSYHLKWKSSETCCATTSLLPLRHLQGGGEQVAHLRSAHPPQAQSDNVLTFVTTIITFDIHIIMKGKSPRSNMCATTTNVTINTKTLEMQTPTSPNKLYIKLRPTFISTREDRETRATKKLLWHQVQGDQVQARATLPSSEAPQGRWPSMGNSLRSWRRAMRCHIIWASYKKKTTRRSSMDHSLRPRRRA